MAAAPALGIEGELPDARAARAEAARARRLRHERGARARQARRPPAPRGRAGDRRRARPGAVPREGRGGRARLPEPVHDRRRGCTTPCARWSSAASATGGSPPHGRRVQVEFVSANPTGPLTLGHARNAAIGDALARLLEATGWTVEREYYFNDAGGQMDRFGASVEARYLQLVGRDAPVPEDGYHGDYVDGPRAGHPRDARVPGSPICPSDERFLRMRAEGVGSGAAADRAHARSVRRRVRRLLPGIGARSEGRDRGGRRPAARGGRRLRRRRRGLVPLDPVRRRQGPGPDPLQRPAHLLRRRLRLHRRQVLPRLRPPRLRARRRPPRRRGSPARGRPRRSGYDPERLELADLPVGLVPARRRAGAHEQALRRTSSRSTSCSTRSGSTPRGSTCCCSRTTRRSTSTSRP